MLKRSKTDQPTRRRGSARILIVDDSPGASTLMARILRRAGFEAAEAADYQLAIATITNEPDLSAVLSSFSIAGSGASIKLLDAVRHHSNPDLRQLPFVMVTDHPRQRLFAWQAKVDEVLVRPVHESVLLESVSAVLHRDERARHAYREEQIALLSRPTDGPSSAPERPVFR